MKKVYGITYDTGDTYEPSQHNEIYVFEREEDCEDFLIKNGYVKDDRGNFTKESYDMTEGELLNANVESFEFLPSCKEESGWLPIDKAPSGTEYDFGFSDWYMVRDTPDQVPYPAYFVEFEGERVWSDAGGDRYKIVTPTEFYKIPKEES